MSFRPITAGPLAPYGDRGIEPAQAILTSRLSPRRSAIGVKPGRDSRSLRLIGTGEEGGYGGNLIERVQGYAQRCVRLSAVEQFDLVHAHDWMTFPAAQAVARRAGRPFFAHVHSTEFDRTGEHVNQEVYDVERAGMHAADGVLAVSARTQRIIVDRYGVSADKVRVVYNGMEQASAPTPRRPRSATKTVLFLGRLTMQKGPEYFLRAAARVSQTLTDVRFIVAGWGDLGPKMIKQCAALGLTDRTTFTGFLSGELVDRAYREADVYVMPSVSEPFGLTALEAVRHGVPVVLSKASGVAEVLRTGSIKVDFWDTEVMADAIVRILTTPALADRLRYHGAQELRGLTWENAALECVSAYDALDRGQFAAQGAASIRRPAAGNDHVLQAVGVCGCVP